jgi:DNA-binding NtrC family response regulator
VSITIPPLRKRKEDIPALAEYFLSTFREGAGRTKISRPLAAVLMKHRWPGNVRELRNRVQQASVLARHRALRPEDFPGLGRSPVTRTSMGEGLLARARKAASKAGIPMQPRYADLFHILASGGSIRRAEYEAVAGISDRTARRDLEIFIAMGLVRKTGRGKSTVYSLAERKRP